jgi:hypothetical protein
VPAPSRAAAPSVAAVPSRSSAAAAASPSAAAPLSAPPPPSAVPAAVPLPPRAATPAVLAPSLPLPALLAHPNDFRVTWFWVGGSRAPRERARACACSTPTATCSLPRSRAGARLHHRAVVPRAWRLHGRRGRDRLLPSGAQQRRQRLHRGLRLRRERRACERSASGAPSSPSLQP